MVGFQFIYMKWRVYVSGGTDGTESAHPHPRQSTHTRARAHLADAGGDGARGDEHRRWRLQALLRVDAVALAVEVVVQPADLYSNTYMRHGEKGAIRTGVEHD